jgi:hypothetical protein
MIQPSMCIHMMVRREVSESDCAVCPHYRGPLRGVGDMVARVTAATGIDAVVHAVAPNCNCGARRAALNAAMPIADSTNKEQ